VQKYTESVRDLLKEVWEEKYWKESGTTLNPQPSSDTKFYEP